MSLSPDALEAYVRDVRQERQQAAAQAALVALARQARPPTRLSLSTVLAALLRK